MYAREDALGWQQSNDFKAAFSIDVEIEFVGVFDTVASVGLIPREMVGPGLLPLCDHLLTLDPAFYQIKQSYQILQVSNYIARTGVHIVNVLPRHAISLDERRSRFKPNLWNRPTEHEHNMGVPRGTMRTYISLTWLGYSSW